MSSPPGTPKKRASLTTSFIKTTNPEVFQVSPRPGGILTINTSDVDFNITDIRTSTKIGEDFDHIDDHDKPQVDEKISKEFRLQTALDETQSIESEDVTFANPIKDAMYVFGVSISSLIMMAANHPNIPEQYLHWTTQCLECIRDDFGNHPPNVQGILNHMKYLKAQTSGGAPPDDPGDSGAAATDTGLEDAAAEDEGAEDAGAEAEDTEVEPAGGEGEKAKEGEGGPKDTEPIRGEGDQTIITTARIRMGNRGEGQ